MKTHNPAKRSSLFLMELMIAILFFSLASAVCVQLFVKSHLLTREAAELNQAVSQAQSAAEVIRTTDCSSSAVSEFLPDAVVDTHGFRLYYDSEWDFCKKKDAKYLLRADLSFQPQMLYSHIEVTDIRGKDCIYELDVNRYLSLAR